MGPLTAGPGLVAALTVGGPPQAIPVVQGPPPQALVVSSQVRAELDAAEAMLSQVDDPALRARVVGRLDAARSLLLRLEEFEAGVGVVIPHRDGVIALGSGTIPDGRVAGDRARADRHRGARARMTDRDFEALAAQISDNSFSSQQLKLLRSGTRDRTVTTAQVMTLMGLFSFGRDQVEAAAHLHAKVADPENWYRVYSVFKFSTDADRLRERVGDTE